MNGDDDSVHSDSNDNPLLDVEDDDARQRRLERLLRRTNCTASHMPSNPPRTVPLPGSSSSLGNPSPLQPPTQLLARLEAFLPQMAAANSDLLQRAQQDPESVNLEHIDSSSDGRYIEMNLGLGVFTMHRRRSDASHAASSSSDNSDSSENSKLDDSHFNRTRNESASSDNNSSDNSESESDSGNSGEHIDAATMLIDAVSGSSGSGQRPIRPLPRRAAPSIIVLSEHPAEHPAEDRV